MEQFIIRKSTRNIKLKNSKNETNPSKPMELEEESYDSEKEITMKMNPYMFTLMVHVPIMENHLPKQDLVFILVKMILEM